MTTYRRRTYVVLCTGAILLLATAPAAVPAAAESRHDARDPSAVLHWNEIAVRTDLAAQQTIQEGVLHLAYTQAAVFDAVDAIDGGYEPYVGDLRARRRTDADAAVAATAHAVLVAQFPNQTAALDADYAASLAAIPDGPGKTRGTALGERAAVDLLAARASDGFEANVPYTFGSGPGVWALPTDNPNTTPATPWVAKMQPFIMRSHDQFRPGPPPALTSPDYTAAYQETKAYGSATNSMRSAEQTQIALFWGLSRADAQYNEAVRRAVIDTDMDRIRAARALALTNLVASDAYIACFDGKYTYSRWRPYTAIRAGDTDGNPNTIADPNWTPLVRTPNHPEYPANHSCITTSFAKTMDNVLGRDHFDVTISEAPFSTDTRHYSSSNELITEIGNARIWGGVHFRYATDAGTGIGVSVADFDYRHALQSEHDHD